jgi:hypothetical protein
MKLVIETSLIGGIEKILKIFRKYNRFAGQDSKFGTPKY